MNKNKKNIILVFFLLLFLILVGYLIYDYTQYKKETEVISREIPKSIEYESIENYEIIETEKGKMVKNENVGLSFIVPDGWNIDKIEEDDTIEISRFSKIDRSNSRLIDGDCDFLIGVDYYLKEDNRPLFILQQIEGREELLEDIQEIIFVNSYPALKTTKKSDTTLLINIELPNINKIYNFILFSLLNDEKNCSEEFDKFLETISIDI